MEALKPYDVTFARIGSCRVNALSVSDALEHAATIDKMFLFESDTERRF